MGTNNDRALPRCVQRRHDVQPPGPQPLDRLGVVDDGPQADNTLSGLGCLGGKLQGALYSVADARCFRDLYAHSFLASLTDMVPSLTGCAARR